VDLVFRQVVAIRWKDSVSEDARAVYRNALDGLRGVPQLVSLVWCDDARHFEGNHDLVAVMDFEDFASARIYTEHPLHQAYLVEARQVVGERVVVQHDWQPT